MVDGIGYHSDPMRWAGEESPLRMHKHFFFGKGDSPALRFLKRLRSSERHRSTHNHLDCVLD